MKKSIITLAILSCIAPLSVDAGKVSVDTVLDASWVSQKYSFADEADRETDTLQVSPTIAMQYLAKKAQINGSVTHIQQRTDFANDIDSISSNFTNYNVQSNLTIIERLLTFNANVAQSYRSFDPNQYLISDTLSPDEDLDKVNQNSFSLVSNIIQGDYFGGVATLTHSSLDIDFEDDNRIDQDTKSQRFAVNLVNGDAVKSLTWSLNYTNSSTDQFTTGQFDSEFLQFSAAFRLYGDLGLSVTAQDETNETTNDGVEINNLREFSSVGLGLSYSPRANRSITLNYNKPSSNDNDDDAFVSGSINWAFSPRTELVANMSKRFYGRSSDAAFNFNNRALRISAGHRESVSSNASLFIDGSTNTAFVCNTGAVNLGDCFIPDTLDYELGLGESFVNIEQPNFSLGDNIIIRKQNFLNMSYQKRKLTLSLNGLDTEDDTSFVDDFSRLSLTQSLTMGINYNAGVFTSINLQRSQSKTETINDGIAVGDGETNRTDLSIERRFGRDFFLSLTLSDIERNGFLPGFSTLQGQDFNDQRLSISIRYQPE